MWPKLKYLFKAKFNFKSFLLAALFIFLSAAVVNVGLYYWQNRHISQNKIILLTQDQYASGGRGSAAMIMNNAVDGKAVGQADLRGEIWDEKEEEKIIDLFKDELLDGQYQAVFVLPELPSGKYRLVFDIRSSSGNDRVSKTIEINNASFIRIMTDRPVYKPGQEMFFRAVVLNKDTLLPLAGQSVAVTIIDPNGNKLSRKELEASKYGIVSDSFSFADELAYGDYSIEAVSRGDSSIHTVEVKDFILPKFETEIIPDNDLSQKQNSVSGRILAKYYFGQPVIGADATIDLKIGHRKVSFSGMTDQNGFLRFNFPNTFLLYHDLQYYSNPKKTVLTAVVVDESGTKIEESRSYPYYQDDILVELIPESGLLKPWVDNEILFISSRSDGTPLQTTVFMSGERLREFATDEFGIAKFTYRPEPSTGGQAQFRLRVQDMRGKAIEKTIEMPYADSRNGTLLLRFPKVLFQAGEPVPVQVLGTKDGPVQLEFSQDGRIAYSEVLAINEGRADAQIILPDRLFGAVEARVWQAIMDLELDAMPANRRDDRKLAIVSDSKYILLESDKGLRVDISVDQPTYRPGADASISLNVSGTDNAPRDAAIGVKIVDEALLALGKDSEASAGLLFLLDDRIREHARPVNGLTWDKVIAHHDLDNRDEIIQAMLLSVPRDALSLSKIEKDNRQAWQSYHKGKKQKYFPLLVCLWLLLAAAFASFWWQLSAYTRAARATFTAWLDVFAAFLLITMVGAFFWGEGTYFAKIVDLLVSRAVLEKILFWHYSFFATLALTVLLLVFAWLLWNKFLAKYRKLVFSFFAMLGLAILLWFLERSGVGMSDDVRSLYFVFFNQLWLFCLIMGGLIFALVRDTVDRQAFALWEWGLILLMGFLSLSFVYVAILTTMLLLIFAGVRFTLSRSGEYREIDEEIASWQEKLDQKMSDAKASDVEIIYLQEILQKKRRRKQVSRLLIIALTTIFSCTLIYQFFMIFIDLSENGHFPLAYRAESILVYAVNIAIAAVIYSFLLGLLRLMTRVGRQSVSWLITGISFTFIAIAVIFAIILFVLSISNNPIERGWFDSDTRGFQDSWDRNGFEWDGGGGGGGIGLGMDYIEDTGLLSPSSASSYGFNNPLAGVFEKGELAKPVQTENLITLESGLAPVFQSVDRVRRFFPETMFWQAELIAPSGRARLSVPVADSITRWRIAASANSLDGKIGEAEAEFTAFQDFFLEYAFPHNLTAGDELILPVTVFNYLSEAQLVRLSVRPDDWFRVAVPIERILRLEPNQSMIINIPLIIEQFGDHVFRIDAEGTRSADAVERNVKILPYARHINQVIASESMSAGSVEFQALFPADVLPGTPKVVFKYYPGIMSSMVEGLESMLRLPTGCFEQTSSALYPNILVLRYLQDNQADVPDIRKKAEDFISQGMQKILTYELTPGGFSYYGQQPAETILSAYGLMEFSDMAKVVFVDGDLIERTKKFIFGRQKRDGSFEMTGSHKGGFSGGDEVSKNAYVIWALSEADGHDQRLSSSLSYLKQKTADATVSAYTLALSANALYNAEGNSEDARRVIGELKRRIEYGVDDGYHLKLDRPSHYGSYGPYGNVELSALAAIVLFRSGDVENAQNLLDYVIGKRGSYGNWGSTQATILALKALVESARARNYIEDNAGTLELLVNGRDKRELAISPENSSVMQYLSFDRGLGSINRISLEVTGEMRGNFTAVKDYYQPFSADYQPVDTDLRLSVAFSPSPSSPQPRSGVTILANQPLSLFVALDTKEQFSNAVVEIPLPSGFMADPASLSCVLRGVPDPVASQCAKYRLPADVLRASRFELKSGKVILYYDVLSAGKKAATVFSLSPTYQGNFKFLPSRLYIYYQPNIEAWSQPIEDIQVLGTKDD